MQELPLFLEDIYEGLRTDISAAGGMKRVGALLWPDKPLGKAAEYLACCINRERSEKLDPEQVMFVVRLAREKVGKSHALTFMCEDTGHEAPRTVEPADEVQKLMSEFTRGVKTQGEMLKRIERLVGEGGLEQILRDHN